MRYCTLTRAIMPFYSGGMKKKHTSSLAVCALRITPGASRVRLIPAGVFTAPRGAMSGQGPWNLTADAADRIIAANATRSTEIVIDYEHQTLLSEQNGLPAPASGWIDPQSLSFDLLASEPGLYGDVTWTPKATGLIAGDEYRYLSPVFPYDPQTGAPLDIMHVALTNTPAINDELAAALSTRGAYFHDLSNHQNDPAEDQPMDLKKLLAAIGLPETTSDADALTAVAALKSKADEAQTQIAALKSATPDPAKFVPVETMQGMQQQIAALSARINDDEAARLISQAMDDGRLVEANRQWAVDLGKSNLAALKSYIELTPAIAALGAKQTDGVDAAAQGAGRAASLTESEMAVCKQLGMTHEEFAKGKVEG